MSAGVVALGAVVTGAHTAEQAETPWIRWASLLLLAMGLYMGWKAWSK